MILATSSSCHGVRRRYCHNVGMTLASPIATRIQLCGPPVIELDGQRLDDRLAGHQSVLLFAYLVLNRHRLCGRDELERTLWADGMAHPSGLNPLVSKLRKLLGA